MTTAKILQTQAVLCQIDIGDISFCRVHRITTNVKGDIVLRSFANCTIATLTPNNKAKGDASHKLSNAWQSIKNNDKKAITTVDIGAIEIQ